MRPRFLWFAIILIKAWPQLVQSSRNLYLGKKWSKQEIAKILVETDFATDDEVRAKWNIKSNKTIWSYKQKLKTDPELLALYQYHKRQFANSWVDDATEALKAGSIRLKQLFKHGSGEEDAVFIKSVVEGVKVLGELHITFNALAEDPPPQPEALSDGKAGNAVVSVEAVDVTDADQ